MADTTAKLRQLLGIFQVKNTFLFASQMQLANNKVNRRFLLFDSVDFALANQQIMHDKMYLKKLKKYDFDGRMVERYFAQYELG